MTFLEALKTGRPIRRTTAVAVPREWISLGYEGTNDIIGTPRWREIMSGKAIGLRGYDYLAEDWEAMP